MSRGRNAPGKIAVTDRDAPSLRWHRVQRQRVCRASIGSVSSRSFRPLAGTSSHLQPARIRETSAMRACLRLRGVRAFLWSHATSTQNFNVFVIRNFICAPVPAAEILSQISVLRTGRPRHVLAASQNCRLKTYQREDKYLPFFGFTTLCRRFFLTDSPKTDAVKYCQRHTNLSSTSQVHTSPYWDCICIRAGG
jgi:hypothetical protein